MDEIWIVILSHLSYINRIQFGRSCKRFFRLANDCTFLKRANKHFSNCFVLPIEDDFTREFCSAFEKHFKKHYTNLDNILYLKYFLSIIKEHLNGRFIFGHVYWCQRSTNLRKYCKFCCPVRRCWVLDRSEADTRYINQLYHYQRYDEHHENLFQNNDYFSKDLNLEFKKCEYFEYIYSYNQLLNFFGIVSVRIFLNIGKNYFFLGKMKQGHMYNYYMFWVSRIFNCVAKALSKQYCSTAIHHLRPVRGYDPSYLKISNSWYIDFLEKKKCICEHS